jgi:hypothetical protein
MHTPGPWEIGRDGQTIFGPNNLPVARLPYQVASDVGATPEETRKANGALIVAAPALLTFAKAVSTRLADLPRYLDENEATTLGSIVRDCIDEADEIAAQAQGEWPWPTHNALTRDRPITATLLAALETLLREAQSRFDGIDTTDEEDAAVEAAETAIAAARGQG